ncbi:MAG: hypothetical protein GXP53_09200, partial [Deltaproteobacteria bacterium]|nr:hypothetical protein [Deltaproteobacteria bacterium]
NFGCSVKKILKSNSGSALMADLKLCERIISAVRKAVSIPLTIKMRSGWDPSGDEAIELSKIAEKCGVDAVCLHPRTARQGFSGNADWSLIRRIKESVNIPVIGNGDINNPADAAKMIKQTGCDAVMIGRAALANPWIFKQAEAVLNGKTPLAVPLELRFKTMRQYLDDAIKRYGEYRACRIMRSRLGWLSKGLANAARFREAIKRIESRDEALELIGNYEKRIWSGHGDDRKKAMERLYLLSKIEKGIAQADKGECISHSEAKKKGLKIG